MSAASGAQRQASRLLREEGKNGSPWGLALLQLSGVESGLDLGPFELTAVALTMLMSSRRDVRGPGVAPGRRTFAGFSQDSAPASVMGAAKLQ